MEAKSMIVSTGGINWEWFIEYHIEGDKVFIERHYRLHKSDEWPEKCRTAPAHPNYYGVDQLKENGDRILQEMFVPGKGWMEVANKKPIFDYK
jgi:hypothetical protein